MAEVVRLEEHREENDETTRKERLINKLRSLASSILKVPRFRNIEIRRFHELQREYAEFSLAIDKYNENREFFRRKINPAMVDLDMNIEESFSTYELEKLGANLCFILGEITMSEESFGAGEKCRKAADTFERAAKRWQLLRQAGIIS